MLSLCGRLRPWFDGRSHIIFLYIIQTTTQISLALDDNNFATGNPLYFGGTSWSNPLINGNNTLVGSSSSNTYNTIFSTLAAHKKGKWYAEFKAISASHKPSFGITQAPNECAYWESYLGKRLYDYAYISDGGIYNNDSETASWGNTFTTGDIIMVALDLDNNFIYFAMFYFLWLS